MAFFDLETAMFCDPNHPTAATLHLMAASVHRSILRLNFVSWAREGVVSALKARHADKTNATTTLETLYETHTGRNRDRWDRMMEDEVFTAQLPGIASIDERRTTG